MCSEYNDTKRDARFQMKEEGSSYALANHSAAYDFYRPGPYHSAKRFAVRQYLALAEAVGAWG
jgi:hypothetical protein